MERDDDDGHDGRRRRASARGAGPGRASPWAHGLAAHRPGYMAPPLLPQPCDPGGRARGRRVQALALESNVAPTFPGQPQEVADPRSASMTNWRTGARRGGNQMAGPEPRARGLVHRLRLQRPGGPDCAASTRRYPRFGEAPTRSSTSLSTTLEHTVHPRRTGTEPRSTTRPAMTSSLFVHQDVYLHSRRPGWMEAAEWLTPGCRL